MAKKMSTTKRPPLKFEEALERLESIVQQLEEGDLGLDEALGSYEEGVGHLKRCYEALGRAERRIELLAGIDDEGTAETTPFEEPEMSLEEKQDARSQRRSASSKGKATRRKGKSSDDIDDSGSLF